MSVFDSAASRFFRPDDVARIQRNQRRINVQRAMHVGRSMILALSLAALGTWAYHRSQSDQRFAVKTIEVTGAVHTSPDAIRAVTASFVGSNLFKVDIARLQRQLRALAWVSRIEIEKKLPDTLRVRIAEREPWALVQTVQGLRYADESGVPFAPLSPAVGDPDLPLIAAAGPQELRRCVQFIRDLRRRDPLLYSRVSEVRPVAPHAFAFFDRDLGTVVLADEDNLSHKWRTLYAVAEAEQLGRGTLQYADLRFTDRIVLKPVRPVTGSAATIVPAQRAEITN